MTDKEKITLLLDELATPEKMGSFFVKNEMLICQECGNPNLIYSGTGTQKVEQLISETFPKSKICRLDMDTSKSNIGLTSILKSFSNQEFDILIGTQMVAKGLDFPNATLVGIINADLGLDVLNNLVLSSSTDSFLFSLCADITNNII